MCVCVSYINILFNPNALSSSTFNSLGSGLTCKFEALFTLWPGLKALRLSTALCPDCLLGTLYSLVHTWECEGSSQERDPNSPQATDLHPANHPSFHVRSHTPGSARGAWRRRGGEGWPALRGLLQRILSASSLQQETFAAAVGTASQRFLMTSSSYTCLFNKQGSSNLGGNFLLSFQLKLQYLSNVALRCHVAIKMLCC